MLDEFVVAGCRRDISPTVKLRSDGQRRPEDVERRLSVDGNDCLAPFLCESRAAAVVGGSQLWRDFAFAEGLASIRWNGAPSTASSSHRYRTAGTGGAPGRPRNTAYNSNWPRIPWPDSTSAACDRGIRRTRSSPLQPVGLVGVTDRHRHHACDPLTFLQVSAQGRQDVLGITIHHASPVRFGRLGRRNLVFDWVLTGQAQMVIGRRAVLSTDDESRSAPRRRRPPANDFHCATERPPARRAGFGRSSLWNCLHRLMIRSPTAMRYPRAARRRH